MSNRLHLAAITLAFACGTGGADAQGGLGDRLPGALSPPANTSQIQLTPEQRRAILTAVKDIKIPPPSNTFTVAVGTQVPPSIEL